MQLEQIVIKPSQNKWFVHYSDEASKRLGTVALDATGNATLAAIIADARQRIPVEQDRPDKPQIEKEITALQDRLTKLKQSIGQA